MSHPGHHGAGVTPALPAQVLVVRHGATEWSQGGRHTGRTDLPLTDLGRRQACDVADLIDALLAGAEPLVFTSPLRRASDTAALAVPDHRAVIVEALSEYDYGSYEGKTSAQIDELHPGWNLFADGCPGGEGLHQVAARCDSFIARLERMAFARPAVVFTHGHLGRILTARLLGLGAGVGRVLQNETASVAHLAAKRGELVLEGWNLQAPASA